MNVRPIQKPLGLAIGPLSVGVAEHEGHFYADVPPLGRLSAVSLDDLADALQLALMEFQQRARAMDAVDLEKALAAAHTARQESLAKLRQDASLEAAREHRLASQRYALLVVLFMPLLNQHAPAWRLAR